jgi:hypothetical protein
MMELCNIIQTRIWDLNRITKRNKLAEPNTRAEKKKKDKTNIRHFGKKIGGRRRHQIEEREFLGEISKSRRRVSNESLMGLSLYLNPEERERERG